MSGATPYFALRQFRLGQHDGFSRLTSSGHHDDECETGPACRRQGRDQRSLTVTDRADPCLIDVGPALEKGNRRQNVAGERL